MIYKYDIPLVFFFNTSSDLNCLCRLLSPYFRSHARRPPSNMNAIAALPALTIAPRARFVRKTAAKPVAKSRATPRPAKRRSGETAAVDTDKPKRARKSSVSAGVSSLFLTSPTTHTHAQSAAAAAPRNLGEGLWVRDTAAGTGASAEAGATVAVLYTCRLHATNKRVDHRSNPNSPFTFILGRGAVVEGLDRGLEGMAVGGERELVVPAHLGYGTAGAPPKIPPDAALHFAIKLLRVGDGEDAAKGGKRRRARGARGGARAAKKKLAASSTPLGRFPLLCPALAASRACSTCLFLSPLAVTGSVASRAVLNSKSRKREGPPPAWACSCPHDRHVRGCQVQSPTSRTLRLQKRPDCDNDQPPQTH